MYGHLERQAGSSLFLLYKAIKCQIEKGPIDMFSQESKYCLSEEGLLRDSRDYSPVTCLVLQRELDEAYHAKVLDCDSITQVKAKVLDAIYKNTPFSLRPSVEEVDLEWQCGQDAHVVLQDIDLTTKEEAGGLKKVNTLRHYGIKNKAVVSLVPKQFNVNTGVMNNNHYSSDGVSASPNSKQFHLRPPESAQSNGRGGASSSSSGGSSSNSGSHSMMEKAQKTIPEMFLTRLLSTKGTIKKFIDDFFRTILSTDAGEFPSAVKWLFDIFDESLRAGYIDDADVVHAWKSNSLPLRFWINLIKNPDFVFDVEKTVSVELNLSIVAQTLMASCLPNDPVLNKETPSHKLLFAREINEYRVWISDFYERVQKMPQVPDQELNCYMHRLSQLHEGEFNRTAALKELFLYVSQYYNDLAVAFSGGIVTSPSPHATSSSGLSSPRLYMSPVPTNPQQDLSVKLEHIFNIVKESDHLYACAS
jgi:plexin A